MNTKITREGFVRSIRSVEESRDRLFQSVGGSIIKTAKCNCKEECKEKKEDTKKEEFKAKMTKEEATKLGFFKDAQQCGWGIYSVSDLDGGMGSVWFLEKDADGIEYLTKQTDQAGDVVRRVKQATA